MSVLDKSKVDINRDADNSSIYQGDDSDPLKHDSIEDSGESLPHYQFYGLAETQSQSQQYQANNEGSQKENTVALAHVNGILPQVLQGLSPALPHSPVKDATRRSERVANHSPARTTKVSFLVYDHVSVVTGMLPLSSLSQRLHLLRPLEVL